MDKIPKNKEEFDSWILGLIISVSAIISSFFAARYFNRSEKDDDKKDEDIKEINYRIDKFNKELGKVMEKLNEKINKNKDEFNEKLSKTEKKGMEDYEKIKDSTRKFATDEQLINVHRRMDKLTEKVSQCATHKDVNDMHQQTENNFHTLFKELGALHSSVKSLQKK